MDKAKLHWFLKIALCTGIWGFVTELLQRFYIPGRTFSLLDTAADFAGGFLAYAVAVYYFIRRKKQALV